MADFIAYLPRVLPLRRTRRDHSEAWWREAVSEIGWWAPVAHATRSRRGPAARVRPGDTLWLVTRVRAPWGPGGGLPPSLDARIEVEAVEPLAGGGWRFQAGPGSRWLPICDATEALSALGARRADGRTAPLVAPGPGFDARLGQSVRTVRELADGAALRAHVAALDARGYAFLSYRVVDGARATLALARELALSGCPVWWDRWSMPRRVADDGQAFRDETMGRSLEAAIGGARIVYIVRSPRYAQAGSWSAWEEALIGRVAREVREWRPG